MSENNTEMSLDEVLSSIKKMVIDEQPPVLELTDMVSENGSIMRVQKDIIPSTNGTGAGDSDADMSSFLRLIQENSSTIEEVSKTIDADLHFGRVKANVTEREERNPLLETIKSALHPVLKEWADENLPAIAAEIIRDEVRKMLYAGLKK